MQLLEAQGQLGSLPAELEAAVRARDVPKFQVCGRCGACPPPCCRVSFQAPICGVRHLSPS